MFNIVWLWCDENCDAIYDRIRYLISLKSDITYIIFHYFAKIKVDSYDYFPKEKILTMQCYNTL